MSETTVIVTGGASGLGAAIVEDLLNAGYCVAVWDIESGHQTHKNLRYFQCDVTNEEQIANTLLSTVADGRKIVGLVNNAGIIHNEPLVSLFSKHRRHSVTSFEKVLNLNLKAPFIITSHVVELMVQTRTKGVIINISSISAKGNSGQTAYSASKAGLEAMNRVWANELGAFGIRCVAIAPGFIETPSTQHALSDEYLNRIKDATALNRLGSTKNISSTVLYAMTNDFLSGCVIAVDGCYTL